MTTEIEKLERRWQENPLGLTFAPLAEAYRKAGQIGKALELLDAGLAQHAGYVPAHIVRGRCHLDSGEQALAELDFLCVAELDPENVIALQGLADIAESEGRISDAIRRLESLLEVDRTSEEARAQLERLREQAAIAPLSSHELRLRNDSETLRPSDEPLPGIMILDIESSLPVAPPVPPQVDPLAGLTGPEPLVEELPPPVAEAAEPAGEASPETGAEPPSDTESGPLAEPELVVTETMAEIFLRQGHRELALAVYSQLLQREPDHPRLTAVIAELTESFAPPAVPGPAEEPPAAEPPPRLYDARSTGGRSVSDFLAALLSAPRPSPSQALHPPAFEPSSAGASEPTGGGGPSFDEFFAPSPDPVPAEGEVAQSEVGLPESPRAQDEEDLAQFNAWLRGLKG